MSLGTGLECSSCLQWYFCSIFAVFSGGIFFGAECFLVGRVLAVWCVCGVGCGGRFAGVKIQLAYVFSILSCLGVVSMKYSLVWVCIS